VLHDDVGFQVLEIDDGYVLVGRTESGREGKRAILIGTDLKGLKIWEKTYRMGSAGISVQKSLDGGFVISGSIDLSEADRDAILIKTDSSGEEEWASLLGGLGEEIGSFALQCRDGGYLLAGITDSFGSGAEDAWLIKLHPGTNQSVEAASAPQGDTIPANYAEINTTVDKATNTAVNITVNASLNTHLNTTDRESEIAEPDGMSQEETLDTQNIFKQKKLSMPDVFSGQDLGYKPLRPLPKADLLRRTGQSA